MYAGVAQLTHGAAFTCTTKPARTVRRWTAGGYETHPDARERSGVPKGTVTQMATWQSRIFAGTTRDWWVYVPAQYNPANPAAVMVFQDGNAARQYVVPVFDNLIAAGDMPVTVGVFVEPGGIKAPRDNRSFEYDTLSDQYVRFLSKRSCRRWKKTARLRRDAAGRAIAGQSQRSDCPSHAAWERPKSSAGCFQELAASPTSNR